MVRRRTRVSATTNKGISVASTAMTESKNFVLSNMYLVKDECHASPKMKHGKNGKSITIKSSNNISQSCIKELNKKRKPLKNKGKICNNGDRIGAAHSYNYTMDNYFKACGVVKEQPVRKKLPANGKIIPTLSVSSQPTTHSAYWHEMKLSPDCLYDLSSGTNDSVQTDDPPEELPLAILNSHSNGFTSNAPTFNNTIGDKFFAFSHNNKSNAITNTKNNIFLQEPVLTLNVDKSPNQASSIKINKSLEIEPKFASHGKCITTDSILHICSNDMVTTIEKESIFSQFKHIEKDDKRFYEVMLPDNDNSSCDSGVVFISSSSSSTIESSNQNSPPPLEHKPTTPHRIVWPSPRREESHDNTSSAVLSPRKSQRHNFSTTTTTISAMINNRAAGAASINSKTRRRLKPGKKEASYTSITKYVNLQNSMVIANNKVQNEKQVTDTNQSDFKTFTITEKNEIAATSIKQRNEDINIRAKHKATKTKGRGKSTTTTATTNSNHCISEYFPVRRSARKTKTAVKEEMMRNLEKAILEERCDGLKIDYFESKGRGVVAERHFQRGEFVIEYIGDLISTTEASEREARYAMDENAGCYMYYFEHKNQQYCIDATEDTGKLGRLVNHSRNGNLITKVVVVKQVPHLVLIAKKDIAPGEELCYDYGDRSKDSLKNHPWLAL